MAGSFDLTVVSPPGDGITSLRFHGEDALLASSWDGTVRAWAVDADAGTSVATRVFETSAPVLDACFAEGGTAACSGGLAAAVSRHDLATGETAVIGAHDDAVKCGTLTTQDDCSQESTCKWASASSTCLPS